MAIRAVFGIGFAAGYVLGARAGRDRYESLVRAFRAVKERPEVQGAAGIVAAQAGTLASRAKAVISRPAGEETLEFSAVTSSNGHGTHAAH
jgi:hypothetical protein